MLPEVRSKDVQKIVAPAMLDSLRQEIAVPSIVPLAFPLFIDGVSFRHIAKKHLELATRTAVTRFGERITGEMALLPRRRDCSGLGREGRPLSETVAMFYAMLRCFMLLFQGKLVPPQGLRTVTLSSAPLTVTKSASRTKWNTSGGIAAVVEQTEGHRGYLAASIVRALGVQWPRVHQLRVAI